MKTGGDLVGGEVDAAEEVRAIIDKSMSIDKMRIGCQIPNSDRPCALSTFFLICLALSLSASVKELARFSSLGFL
jgi:hypothetical protein